MPRPYMLVLLFAAMAFGGDPYEDYVRKAPEFRRVPTVAAPTPDWLYMPWRYKWPIGTGDAAGQFCRDHGINGGMIDHGAGPFRWLEKWNLRFYADHMAGKGTLFLRPVEYNAGATGLVRPVPLDAAKLEVLRRLVRARVRAVSKSPMRWAYALDDEISWGVLVRPTCWRVNGNDRRYKNWLRTCYGRAVEARFVNAQFAIDQLDRPVARIDFSPFLDRMSYQDSVLAGFVGDLVQVANAEDPTIPCGVVGAQAPSLWGGYDYAKLMKKVQFLEPYDLGSAPEIARSLGNATIVSTHFRDPARKPEREAWVAWSRFAHGQRGMVGWVENWFDGKTPRPWLKEFARTLRELARQGPKLHGARWMHDGIAVYYSHPSIQVSWILDSRAHGKTWQRRNRDHLLGTSHLVRKSWELLLNDAGLQYQFVSYDDVVRDGVPEEYKVLILPACFALSDAEARRIRGFVERGGTVVADFMCGLFDQHGKGRTKGALDDLFGVTHDGTETAASFFDGHWVETDQDRGYGKARWQGLFGTRGGKMRGGFKVPEQNLARVARHDRATYLNLSPQLYLQLRAEGRAEPRHRRLFLEGIKPAVRTESPEIELTRWSKGDRIYLFVVRNPTMQPDGTRAPKPARRVTLHFSHRPGKLVDERTGRPLESDGVIRVTPPALLSYAR